jgi:hypothetical protein
VAVPENPAANLSRDARREAHYGEERRSSGSAWCARQYDHPFERWTQNRYYEMAAFFSAVGLRPGYEVGEEILYD